MLVENVLQTNNASLDVGALYRYQYGNHLGSVSLETDAGASVISFEEYHPYGTSAYRAANATVRATAKRYRYTGKERDDESGLHYNGARYYAPWLARWTQADPASLVDGGNLYAYVRGNPVRLVDPSGTATTTYLGHSTDWPYVQRLQEVWGAGLYWSHEGPHGQGWYVKTQGREILPAPVPEDEGPAEMPTGEGLGFLTWDPNECGRAGRRS